jgi:hypothetical protein
MQPAPDAPTRIEALAALGHGSDSLRRHLADDHQVHHLAANGPHAFGALAALHAVIERSERPV